jgi:hypothetical protein
MTDGATQQGEGLANRSAPTDGAECICCDKIPSDD